MNEAIAILSFVLIMIILGIKNAEKIQVKAKTNYVRRIMAVIISVAAIVLFWSKSLYFKVELIALILLLFFCAFAPEGLGKNKIIKVGSLNGSVNEYQRIELEPEDAANRFTRINFYRYKNNFSTLIVKGNMNVVKSYLLKQMVHSERLNIKEQRK